MADTAESYQPLGKPERVDRDKGVIYGVRVCGRKSKNGGEYPAAVQARDIDRYNGLNVYVDMGHHQTQRDTNIPVPFKFGYTANAKAVDGGIDVDLHFNPEQAFAKEFCWAADNDPKHYGFSHYADVSWKNTSGGTRVAESIRRVIRLDIVGDPATTTSIFESTKDMENDPRSIASTITSPDALKTFLAAFFDALPSGSFDNPSKAAALTDLMTKYGDAPADPNADEIHAMESLRGFGPVGKWASDRLGLIKAEREKADRLKKAGELCDAEKLPGHLKTETFIGLVAESIADPAKAKALIADRLAVGKPASSGTTSATSESVGGGGTTPRTTDRTSTGGGNTKSVKDIVGEYAAGKR